MLCKTCYGVNYNECLTCMGNRHIENDKCRCPDGEVEEYLDNCIVDKAMEALGNTGKTASSTTTIVSGALGVSNLPVL